MANGFIMGRRIPPPGGGMELYDYRSSAIVWQFMGG